MSHESVKDQHVSGGPVLGDLMGKTCSWESGEGRPGLLRRGQEGVRFPVGPGGGAWSCGDLEGAGGTYVQSPKAGGARWRGAGLGGGTG